MLTVQGLVWPQRAACRSAHRAYDRAVDATGHHARVRRDAFIATYCDRCEVAADCLAWGRDTASTGIFGGQRLTYGHTDAERQARRGQARAAAPLAA